MLRIIFLVLMVMMSAYGYTIDTTSTTVYKSDFGIYVYGDVVSIENAFILVQAIAKSAEMTTIIALMAAILLPFMAYQYFTTSESSSAIIIIWLRTRRETPTRNAPAVDDRGAVGRHEHVADPRGRADGDRLRDDVVRRGVKPAEVRDEVEPPSLRSWIIDAVPIVRPRPRDVAVLSRTRSSRRCP